MSASAQARSARQRGAQMDGDSLYYSSLQFEEKHRKPKEEVVYAQVSIPTPKTHKEKQREKTEDYENAAYAAKPSCPSDYETDESNDEVEILYSQVNFKPKDKNRRPKRGHGDSEENTQYSELRI